MAARFSRVDDNEAVKEPEFAVVGGGIAGCSLATMLARAGARVLVLERQSAYRDQVRGEILWPWGVRLARMLGIEPILLDAGARVVRWLDTFDEGAPATRDDVGEFVDGINGSLNIAHPRACSALAAAAAAAGADVQPGARDIRVTTGKKPVLRWEDVGGSQRETRCRLIVGADGRRSSVRSQSGIALEVDAPAHLIAGVLADGIEGIDEDANLIAREADLSFFSFPQGDGRAPLPLFPDSRAVPFWRTQRSEALSQRLWTHLSRRGGGLDHRPARRAVRHLSRGRQPHSPPSRGRDCPNW